MGGRVLSLINGIVQQLQTLLDDLIISVSTITQRLDDSLSRIAQLEQEILDKEATITQLLAEIEVLKDPDTSQVTTKKLSTFPNISGSINSYTGNIKANLLTITSSHDFQVGQGIAIKNAGTYHDGWLRTTITAINGNTLTLQNSASSNASNTLVNHDDSVAVQTAVNNLTDDILLFDYIHLNLEDISLKSDVIYDGNECCVFTPLYCNQNSPKYIWSIFKITDKENITFKNFEHNGGKKLGVNSNDQFGTCFMLSLNITHCIFDNNFVHDNFYAAYRMLDTQKNISITNNTVNFTDVAFCFMPQYKGTAHIENILIEGNKIDGTGCNSEAIAFLPAAYNWKNYSTGAVLASSKNITIKNNYIIKPTRINLVYGAISENVLIEGNTFSAAIAISTYDNALELKDGSGVIQPSWCTANRIVINNNHFIYTLYEAIRLSGINVLCVGNTFSNIKGGSLWCGADEYGVRGTLEIRNHNFNVGNKPIVLEYGKPMGNVTFIDNEITATTDTHVIYLKTGIANISGNTGAENTNCTVHKGSIVAAGQFKSINYI